MASPVSKTWDFTLNNYTDEEVQAITVNWQTEVKKMTVSKEVGETGTPHLQGRITFARAYRLPALQKLVPRAHWEPTKAAADSLYVMKVGSEVIVQIDKRSQGQRTDIAAALKILKENAGKVDPLQALEEAMPEFLFKHNRNVEYMANRFVVPRTAHPTVTVYYGGTGVGKTHRAYETLGMKEGEIPFIQDESMEKWFDGVRSGPSLCYSELEARYQSCCELEEVTGS